MHSPRRMFMTIVRVLLPKIPWKHKEGAILKGASNVPQNCRMETTAFGKKHPGRSWRCATRTTERLKRSVVSSWEKKKRVQKSETKRRYIRIEKGGYHVSDQTLLLTAKMVNSCKSKDHREGKKDSKPS